MTVQHRAAALLVGVALALVVAPGATAYAEQAPRLREPARPIVATRAFVVGDSLTVGTLYCRPPYPCLPATMTRAGVRLSPPPDARIGRKVAEGLAVPASAGTRIGTSTVVIALGTNDVGVADPRTAARGWVVRARSILGTDATFVWVNLRLTGTRFAHQAAINQGLLDGVRADERAQRAAHRGGRAAVLDWSSYAAATGTANGRDGIHYSPQGYQVRAAFYAGTLSGDPVFAPWVLT